MAPVALSTATAWYKNPNTTPFYHTDPKGTFKSVNPGEIFEGLERYYDYFTKGTKDTPASLTKIPSPNETKPAAEPVLSLSTNSPSPPVLPVAPERMREEDLLGMPRQKIAKLAKQHGIEVTEKMTVEDITRILVARPMERV
jgi:hypothetical protein